MRTIPAMQVIDFHTHVLPPEFAAQRERLCQREPWFGRLHANPRAPIATAEELLRSMSEDEVGASVAFGFAFSDQGLCRACNEYVTGVAAQSEGRVIPFAVVSPRAGDAVATARYALEAGAAGIGELMPDGQGFRLMDYAVLDPIMELARAFRVPVLTHVNEPLGHDYAGKGSQGPAQALALAQRYPENVLVFCHWGGGLPFYELMPEVRAALRRVYYDTAASPFLYDDSVFRHVMSWAPRKVILGTDYPLLKQKRFLDRVRRVGLDSDALAWLLGGNARLALGFVAQDEL